MHPAPAIIVTGNIASGKSTLCKGLHAALPDHRYLCVDRMRVELAAEGIFGLDAEHIAAKRLLDALREAGPLIYESSGATQLYRRASSWLRGHRRGSVLRLRTTCGHALAMRRFHERKAKGHRQMAPAFKNALPIHECWYRFEDMLREPVDLVLDTGKLNAEQTLAAALEAVRRKFPYEQQPPIG